MRCLKYFGAFLALLYNFTFITCQVHCDGSVCGANEVCVNSKCECEFGFKKENGFLFCERVPDFIQDRIIKVNRMKGVLHELFEGDIKLNPSQRQAIDVVKDLYNWELLGRRAASNSVPAIPVNYWRLPIPTTFAPDVANTVKSYFSGNKFFRDFKTGDTDYIMVTNGQGCWSYVGRQGGMQLLSIDNECQDPDMMNHLTMHTLGMWHEQNRIDRNKYITLHTQNMEKVVAEYHIGCFPPSSVVQLNTGEKKLIGDLMIGDNVMVMDDNNRVSFSDVNLMMHKQEKALINYIILETEDGVTLTLSKEHVVFVSSAWSFSPETRMAQTVKVGDYLYRPEMTNGTFTPVKVSSVRQEVMKGAYAPTTLAGNVVVDGHLASSYVFIENQDVAHSFFLPWRVGYNLYNSIFGKSLYEPASGFHWSLQAFVSAYCTLVGHDLCAELQKI